MGVRYFCDRCEKEFISNGLAIETWARDALGVKIAYMGNGLLCEKCAKKFNMVKDRLKCEEDFFTMKDDEISLMEYDFKVGDKVITSTGQVGVIESICNCDRCKERGFYEPNVKTTSGVGTIWITDTDKENGFISFYQIGNYKFGNVDKESIRYDIELETHNIEASNKKLEEYHKQLERISCLSALDLCKEMLDN